MGRGIHATAIGLVGVLWCQSGARAVDLEKLVMPGPVSQAHLDVEGDCGRCHSPFDQGGEDALCIDCHEPVDTDRRGGLGFHGRSPAARTGACRSCHTEHEGRDADIVGLTSETFDHSATDYTLADAHRSVACSGCHASGDKYREAPSDCIACHGEQDIHAGQMGEDCATCHSEAGWQETRFDHAETGFPLEGGHVAAACGSCHLARRYQEVGNRCRDCHGVDDAHRGRFGADCGRCHSPAGWKKATFDHSKTGFPLAGRHVAASCASCHPPSAPGAKARPLETRCEGCHRVEDVHRGRHGDDCAACHDPRGWKHVRFDHLKETGFGLAGAHEPLACGRCHSGRLGEETLSSDCQACHAADDPHSGKQGEACGRCHDVASWTANVTFDHDLTRFPLLGLHVAASCEDCHQSASFHGTPADCVDCHADGDVHEGAQGPRCATCHNPNGWAFWRFDHDRQTSFPLSGAHQGLACDGCHSAAVADTPRLGSACESCHGAADPHRGSFGSTCGVCHTDESWSTLRIGR